MNREEYIKSVTAMTETEIRDLLCAGLIGPLPKVTMSRVFATLAKHADHLALLAQIRQEVEQLPHDALCVSRASFSPDVVPAEVDCDCPRGRALALLEVGL